MKCLGEKQKAKAADAWGRDQVFFQQFLEVEQADVGSKRDHYLGYRQHRYEFKVSDVGRKICVLTYPDQEYTGWNFSG